MTFQIVLVIKGKRVRKLAMTEQGILPRCRELEELELATGENQLTITNYAELLFIYLVQQRLIEAKFCYYRASTKFNKALLRDLDEIRKDLSNFAFGNAIKKCRVLQVDSALQPYLNELKNRLIAIQLQLVCKCYASIEKRNFADLLGLVDESGDVLVNEANDIFNVLLDKTKCGWMCDEESVYILPNDSPSFQETIASLIDVSQFGRLDHGLRHSNDQNFTTIDNNTFEAVRALVDCSDFFDSN